MGPVELIKLGLKEAPVTKLLVAAAAAFALVVLILGWSSIPPAILVVGALIIVALAFVMALLGGLAGIWRQSRYQHHFVYPLLAVVWGMSIAFILVIFLLIYSAFSAGMKGAFGSLLGSVSTALGGQECDPETMSLEEYLECEKEPSP
jgi:hypothetical protein